MVRKSWPELQEKAAGREPVVSSWGSYGCLIGMLDQVKAPEALLFVDAHLGHSPEQLPFDRHCGSVRVERLPTSGKTSN
ncbi:hypothetical protein NQZ68_007938 [Dissostichus eleginoides]|nr:hypothetical protein NQZ68_007938 [Dissostichus eleginoides]